MSAVPIRTFTATLSRSTSPIAWEAFAGAPLSIVGALPAGQDFAGVTAVRAELHDSLTNSEAPLAVSDALTALPTGSSVTLTFSSAATNRPAGRYWVSVYATYADARLEVFRLAELHLVEGAVSQLTPQAPAPALYATSAEITAVLDRVEIQFEIRMLQVQVVVHHVVRCIEHVARQHVNHHPVQQSLLFARAKKPSCLHAF